MNTLMLFVVDIAVLLFFGMRFVAGKRWGKASTKPTSLWNFLAKEFLLICFVVLAVLQHFDVGYFIFPKPIFVLYAVCLSLLGVYFCFETRRARATTWKRYGEAPDKHVLTTHGPYSASRHPYYLGLTVWAMGISMAYGNLLLMGLAVVWTVCAITVSVLEERMLEETFGDEWRTYKARVPFWTGFRRE
jgi:protein-S-isoprenylcysteine O-methyltransferase Ste14